MSEDKATLKKMVEALRKIRQVQEAVKEAAREAKG